MPELCNLGTLCGGQYSWAIQRLKLQQSNRVAPHGAIPPLPLFVLLVSPNKSVCIP